MLYCDYETYHTGGGTLSPEEFAVWCPRASRMIDRLAHGRAERHAAELAEELADACGQIAGLLSAQSRTAAGSLGLSSASNDGYSESYTDPAQAAQSLEGLCRRVLSDALGADRHGLLYAGVYPC